MLDKFLKPILSSPLLSHVRPRWRLAYGLTAVAFAALFILRNDQDHGGDFAQYFIMGANIFEGRSIAYQLDGYPSVLPTVPLLFGLIHTIIGVNFFVLGLLNTIAWSRSVVIADHFLKLQQHSTKFGPSPRFLLVVRLSCLSILTTSGWVLNLLNQAQPTFIFCWILMEFLWRTAREIQHNSPKGLSLVVFWSTILSFTRPEAAIFVGLFAVIVVQNRLVKKNFYGLLAFTPLLAVQAYTTISSNYTAMTQYGGFDSGVDSPLSLIIRALRGFGYFLLGPIHSLHIHLPLVNVELTRHQYLPVPSSFIHVGCAVVLLFGGAKLVKKSPLFGIAFCLSAGFVYREALSLGAIPVRYMLPYFPLALVMMAVGSMQLIGERGQKSIKRYAMHLSNLQALGILTLIGLLWLPRAIDYGEPMKWFYHQDSFETAVTQLELELRKAATDSQNFEPSGVGFYKPRTLQLALLERSVRTQVRTTRSAEHTERLCETGGVSLLHARSGNGQRGIADFYFLDTETEKECRVVWRNDDWYIVAPSIQDPKSTNTLAPDLKGTLKMFAF